MCLASTAVGFVPYYNYEGDLTVQGWVASYPNNGNIVIDYALEGTDPDCLDGPDTTLSANSCGIHIHTGTSCDEDAGGHYYSSELTEDPWGAGYYQGSSQNDMVQHSAVANMGIFELYAGLGSTEITGRTMIIHDKSGARIACAIVHPPSAPQAVGAFKPYYDVDQAAIDALPDKWEWMSSGSVEAVGEYTVLKFTVAAVDAACMGGPNTTLSANSCGVHIHTGTSCDEDAGGHYYSSELTEDPWGAGYYVQQATFGPSFAGTSVVKTGLTADEMSGKVVVVHDLSGARILCAPVGAPQGAMAVPELAPYPGYTGDLSISGGVIIHSVPAPDGGDSHMQQVSVTIDGADPRCTAPNFVEYANSCGVHLHEGMTCDDAGGHWYNTDLIMEDPWAKVSYVYGTNPSNTGSSTAVSQAVYIGYAPEDFPGKTFVVHDYEGSRVACGYVSYASTICAR